MHPKLAIAAAMSTACLLLAAPAVAQEPPKCGPLDKIAEMLATEYHESPVVEGVVNGGEQMLMVWAAPDYSTWTAVLVRASDRLACLVGFGRQLAVKQPQAPVDQGTGL